jgi:hypothetical protein
MSFWQAISSVLRRLNPDVTKKTVAHEERMAQERAVSTVL